MELLSLRLKIENHARMLKDKHAMNGRHLISESGAE